MLGLETALALALTELGADPATAAGLLSWKAATIAGIDDVHGCPIAAGSPANLAIFDPTIEWTVSGEAMASHSSNTPYEGRTLRGKVRHTIVHGRPAVIDQEVQS